MKMRTITDSNVVLDTLGRGTDWQAWSSQRLNECYSDGALVINQIVYAEVASELDRRSALDDVLSRLGIEQEHMPFDACFQAGHAYRAYRKQGGKRERVLPDFLIGAHAAAKGYRILTRDAARYRTYFPGVEIIAPDTHP